MLLFVVRLLNGQLGLALTYWVFGVLGAIMWKIAFQLLLPSPEGSLALVVIALMAVYFAFIYVAIWRAANKYKGRKEWALLAKTAVILGALATCVPLLVGFSR